MRCLTHNCEMTLHQYYGWYHRQGPEFCNGRGFPSEKKTKTKELLSKAYPKGLPWQVSKQEK